MAQTPTRTPTPAPTSPSATPSAAQVSPGSASSPVAFSIVIETENLASADLDGLFRSLDALERQTLSPRQACDVLMVETGDVPETVLAAIRQRYPWVTVRRIDAGLEYYQAKMRGIEMTAGEAIVLCDSDCVYEDSWLAAMLAPFGDGAVQMVAGETSLNITGPYELAMALTYIFPRYSQRRDLQPASGYFCNNVAFRRSLLAQFPIPGELPVYRGNCVIHAHQLAAHQRKIWQQPQARALHAPPNGFSHFVSRFLMLGYDALCVSRFAADPTAEVAGDRPAPLRPLRDLAVAGLILAHKLKVVAQRLGRVLREDLRYALYLPVALPIALAALALYSVGLGIAYLRPGYWLNNRDTLEALLEHS